MTRILTYADAIRDAQRELLRSSDDVVLLGLGIPGPTGVFGTSLGLQEEFGVDRVLDIPAAENGITGVTLGMAIMGMRPILVHQRMDFAVLSLEPIVNQAAKWHYMYGGAATAPLTIRMIVGRGWGQGPQHSQSLQAWFAHVPGLRVMMPANAADAKGMLVAAVQGDAPTVIIEHRWLFDVLGEVPEGLYASPIGQARVLRHGSDVTLVGTSFMVLECLAAADRLLQVGVSAEVIDLASISPMDDETVLESVGRTRRLLVADTGHAEFGVGAEVVARVCTSIADELVANPERVGPPFAPTPTTYALADLYYASARDIVERVGRMCDANVEAIAWPELQAPLDVPSREFRGPY